jgi:hypothetical protein
VPAAKVGARIEAQARQQVQSSKQINQKTAFKKAFQETA